MKIENTENFYKKFIVYVIFYGITIRIYQYLGNRDLWTDELMLFEAVTNRGLFDLNLLNHDQFAPIFFVILTQIFLYFSTLIDFNEINLTIRVIPLVSSIGSIFLFHKICKIFFCNKVILLGIFIFSTSPNLIYYSQEFKQYSLDVFFGLLIFYTYLNYEKYNPKKKIYLIFISFWLPFISHASIFTFGAVIVHALIKNIRLKNIIKLSKIIITGIFFLISFLFNYFFFIANISAKDHVVNFWKNNYLPLPFSIDNIKLWFKIFGQFYTYSGFSILLSPIILFLVLVSIKLFLKKRSDILQLIFITFFLLIIASMINAYPFSGRLVLFALPLFYLILLNSLNHYYLNNKNYLKIFFSSILILSFLFHFIFSFEKIITPSVKKLNKLQKYERELIIQNTFDNFLLLQK